MSRVHQDLSTLRDAYLEHTRQGQSRAIFEPERAIIQVYDGYVIVDAVANGDGEFLESDLKRFGLKNSAVAGPVVSGFLPIEALDEVSALSSLRYIMPAYKPALNMGLVTSQGDVAQRSELGRLNFDVDGSGSKIGILSDSFNTTGGQPGDVSNGDLPGTNNPNGYTTPVDILDDTVSGIDEGRAMGQIIHDVAPGADLAFHTGFIGLAGMAYAIRDLAYVADCNIIVDDVRNLLETMFQDGPIAQAVDEVVGTGVTYFSSAGNYGDESYQASFRDSGTNASSGPPFYGGDAHDFDAGPGTDVFQQIVVPAGGYVWLTYQWTDPSTLAGPTAPGPDTDMDIFLLDSPSFAANVLEEGNQDNISSGSPIEILYYENTTGSAQTLYLAITRYDGPDPALVKWINITELSSIEHDTQSGTVFGHSNAEGANSVGAAFFWDTPEYGTTPPVIEDFSSRGGVPVYFDNDGNWIGPNIRYKPNFVAPDGTNTTFLGNDIPDEYDDTDTYPNFFGTSAAAPHAAGVAALLLDYHGPCLTESDIRTVLQDTAIPMSAYPFDYDSGFGFIDANAALAAIDQTAPVVTVPGNVTIACAGDIPPEPTGRAWGMWANSDGLAEALRDFSSPVAVNETFILEMDNGWIDGTNGSVGFGLQNIATAQNRFEFYFHQGDLNYMISDGTGTVDTGISFSDEGVHVEFTLTDTDAYHLRVVELHNDDTHVFTGTLAGTAGTSIDRLRLFNYNAGPDGNRDAFFNSLRTSSGAYDDASNAVYDDGWQNGDNGGSGFGAWTLQGSNSHGHFVASSANNGDGDDNSDADIDTFEATVVDDCDPHPLLIYNGQTDNGGTGCSSDPLVITRAWYAEDKDGNNVTEYQTITVQDAVQPQIDTCLPNQTLTVTNGTCEVVVPDWTDQLVASDNCGIASITQNPTAGSILPCGDTYTITFTVVDDCGNSAQCTAQVSVEGWDYGDAEDPPYATLDANNGARHQIDGATYLGSLVDPDPDGQPTANHQGDNLDGDGLDDDGVTVDTQLVPGNNAQVTVTASAAGLLNAWCDFNIDGDWLDSGEQIFTDQPLVAGANVLNFTVPAAAAYGATVARFRFSTQSGLAPTGPATDGEVEDYAVSIQHEKSVIVAESDGSTEVAEGGVADTYTLVLSEVPLSSVSIAISSDSQVSATPTTVTFTTTNWSTPQTVTVSAINDLVSEGPHTGTVTHTVTSGDPDYNGIAVSDVVAIITDNDGLIGDFVWHDVNANGIQDSGEPGLAAVTVRLYASVGKLLASDQTDANGFYEFNRITPADYYLLVTAPAGMAFTAPDQGPDDAVDSDVDPQTARTPVFTLDTAQIMDTSRDAGLNAIPTLTPTSGSLAYAEGSGALPIAPNLVVTDDDQAASSLVQTRVWISQNFNDTADALAFTPSANVTGSFDQATGLLTLDGPASATEFQTVLRSVTFSHSSDNPTVLTRTIRLEIDDALSTSPLATRSITIEAINDAPINLLNGNSVWATQTLAEDALLTFSPANQNALTITDPDVGMQQMQVTLTATNGTLHITNLNGLNYFYGQNTANLTLRGTLSVLINALNGLTFTPSADFAGSATITWNTSDRGNTGSGGTLTDEDIIHIGVDAVNDPPSFDPVSNPPVVLEDAGLQTISNFASGMDDGDADQTQALSFVTTLISTTGSLAFTTTPAVDVSGTLTYEPAAQTNGTATVEIYLQDDGGTANGGLDTSPTQTFTITVLAVNDAPQLSLLGDPPALNEDAAPVTIANFIQTATPGPPAATDEAGQTLTLQVAVTGSSGDLQFAIPPTLNLATGELSYQPAANTSGTATIEVYLQDNGGTANGGSNTSPTETFTITVEPVNDPPIALDDTATTLEDVAVLIDVAANDTDSDGNIDPASVSVVVGQEPQHGTLTNHGDGTLTYTPTLNFNGNDSFTYEICDDGTPLPAACDQAIVAITVIGDNDGPTLSVPGPQSVAEDDFVDITGISVDDTDAGANPLILTITATHGNLSLLDATHLTFLDGDGDHALTVQGLLSDLDAALAAGVRYQGDADYNGPDLLDVLLDDQQGSRAQANATISMTVTPVNDPSQLSAPAALAVETAAPVGIPGISVADDDVQEYSGLLSISLTVGSGQLSTDGSTWQSTWSFLDTPANLNAILDDLQYQTSSCSDDQLAIELVDEGDPADGGVDDFQLNESVLLQVVDTMPPTAQCQTFSVTLDTNGEAFVVPMDMDAGSSDACSSVDLEIYKVNPPPDDGSTPTELIFTCLEIGTHDVELVVTDGAGNSSSCLTQVTVSDPDNSCAPCEGFDTTVRLTFPGRVFTAFSPPVNLYNNTVGDVFFGLPYKVVYTRDCNGTYDILGDGDPLESGKSYMVKTGLYGSIQVPFTGCVPDGPVQISRCGTWNGFMAGNPYNYPLPIDNFQLTPAVPGYFLVWVNGSWRTGITTVPVGGAVLIYTSATQLTIMPDPPTAMLMYASDATPDQLTDDTPLSATASQSNWSYRLDQNMPNPFTHTATIRYQLPVGQRVKLDVFNVAGQLITTLVDSDVSAGDHEITWDGTNANGESVNSGVYFYRLTTNDFSETKRMVLMR